jgi:hypothetical protein
VARAGDPSATNASIDWYILDSGADPFDNYLEYKGAGFVSIYGSGPTLTVRLANAVVYPEASRGINAPKGGVDLSGTMKARRDDQFVTNYLSQLREMSPAADRTGGQPNAGPPRRTPAGP